MLEFDHVILPVSNLYAAAKTMWDEHGLASVDGGRHPGHGTANRLIPLGREYLELVAVVDEAEAASSPFGSWVRENVDSGGSRGICLRSDDLDSLATRLDIQPVVMSRTRPDGVHLHWRLLGMETALGAGLPFFIEWNVAQEDHPGWAVAPHRVSPFGMTWVEIGGVGDDLESWLGPHELDLRLVDGSPGVDRVALWTDSGDLII